MGRIKHISKIKAIIEEAAVFRAADIERLAGNKAYAHLLLHNLAKQKNVYRLMKGWYSKEDDPILSVFCFKPAYLGLQSALSFRNLWEQETNPVIITVKKARAGVRKVFGNNVVVHRLNPKYFFGFDFLERENYLVPVSDIEKTLIDFVYFKIKLDLKLTRKLGKKLNRGKLNLYLEKYPLKFRKKAIKLILFADETV